VIITTTMPKIAKQFGGAGGILHNGKIKLFATVHEAIANFNALPQPAPASGFDELVEPDADDEEEEWL
jgi:hypothetical protein